MKLKKVLALVLALGMTVSAFAACGNGGTSSTSSEGSKSSESSTSSESGTSSTDEPTDEPSGDPAAYNTAIFQKKAVDPAKSIILNAGMEPTGLNTLLATYSIEFSMFKHLYENLVMLDKDDKVVPGAAESWEISEDQTVYTFKLHQDGVWTNGDPVTAKDFEFAWSQALNPEVASDYAYFLYMIKNGEKYYNGECDWADVGVKVLDDYTLEVTLEQPTAYALSQFTFGTFAPINQSFYEGVGADLYATEAAYFCTNGAYALTDWTHNDSVIFQKNDAFHNAANVNVEEIVWKIITEPNAALSSFLAGELDVVGLGTGELIKQAEATGAEIQSYSDGGTFYIYFNHSNEYLKNANLRQALALGFDKQAMLDTVYQNANKAMTSFTTPAVAGADGTSFAESLGELTPVNGDIEKAKEYLAKALEELGCTVEDLTAALSIDCGDSSTATAEASFYQEAWRQNLGIEVTVNQMQTKQGSQNRKDGNYVMSLTGWGPDYNDPMTFLDLWVSTSGNNQTFYASEAYDELVKKATTETDLEKRQGYFAEIEQLIVQDLPVAPSYWRYPSYAVSDKIKGGLVRSTFQDINAMWVTLE